MNYYLSMDDKKEKDLTEKSQLEDFPKPHRWVYILPAVIIGLMTVGILVFIIVSAAIK